MFIKVKPLYFVTKSFPYNLTYDEMISNLSNHSIKFMDNKLSRNPDLNSFINDFFFNEEFDSFRDFHHFNPSAESIKNEISISAKKEFVIFRIDCAFLEKFWLDQFSYLKVEDHYRKLLLISNEIYKLIVASKDFQKVFNLHHSVYKAFCDLYEVTSSFENKSYNFETIEEFFRISKAKFITIKESFYYSNNSEQCTFENQYNELLKSYKKIKYYFDLVSTFRSKHNIELFAIVSKHKTISFSFLYENGEHSFELGKDFNYLIPALSLADTMNSDLSSLTRAFTLFNFNNIFDLKNVIYGFDELNGSSFDEFNNLEPIKKSIFVKYVIPSLNNCSKETILNVQKFYRLSSIATALDHSLDKHFLVENFDKNNKIIEKFCCYDKNTELCYFDDNKFTITVMNTEVQKQLLCYINEGSNVNSAHSVSHLARLYALRRFNSLCSCIAFASLTSCLYRMVKKLRRFRSSWLILENGYYDYYVKLLNNTYANIFLGAKQLEISRLAFEKLNILDQNGKVVLFSEINDCYSQTKNIQTFKNFSIVFTIASLLLTLMSFGLVSRVFVQGIQHTNSVSGKEPISKFSNLFQEFLTSQKFYVAVAVAIIPFIVATAIYLWVKIYVSKRSISKLVFKKKRNFFKYFLKKRKK